MTFLSRLTFGILLAASMTIGCSGDSSSTNPGTGGTGGRRRRHRHRWRRRPGGGGTGGGGPRPSWPSPPAAQSRLHHDRTRRSRSAVTSLGFNYAPKCLKVSAGATVTFNGETSPRTPWRRPRCAERLTGNPITATSTGTTESFTFPTPGFYAYYCTFHGSTATTFMTGVIWVK